jgi:hypothetical protein
MKDLDELQDEFDLIESKLENLSSAAMSEDYFSSEKEEGLALLHIDTLEKLLNVLKARILHLKYEKMKKSSFAYLNELDEIMDKLKK